MKALDLARKIDAIKTAKKQKIIVINKEREEGVYTINEKRFDQYTGREVSPVISRINIGDLKAIKTRLESQLQKITDAINELESIKVSNK